MAESGSLIFADYRRVINKMIKYYCEIFTELTRNRAKINLKIELCMGDGCWALT